MPTLKKHAYLSPIAYKTVAADLRWSYMISDFHKWGREHPRVTSQSPWFLDAMLLGIPSLLISNFKARQRQRRESNYSTMWWTTYHLCMVSLDAMKNACGLSQLPQMKREEWTEGVWEVCDELHCSNVAACKEQAWQLRVDSGPGRLNHDLITRLMCLGFILYPCVPNTTHVT